MTMALVLGGNSFIGRCLLARFRREGLSVVATSRSALPHFIPCDLTNAVDIDAVVAATLPRWIVQCAGATKGGTRADMDRVHVNGTRSLLEAVARHIPDATVLLFGSAAEYGNVPISALPVGEDFPAQPQSAFGQSKLAQTRTAEDISSHLHLRTLILRPFNVLGPGLPAHYLAGTLGRQLLNKGSGEIVINNGQATRDWVDVRDVAEAVMGLLSQETATKAEVRIYNVATGIETPVLDVARELCRVAGRCTAVSGQGEPDRSGILRSCGDSSRLRSAIGWQPRITWQQSLADLWQALQEESR